MNIDTGAMPAWLGWPTFLFILFLWVKTYGYIRDRWGTDDSSWVEGVGAFVLAAWLFPFMVVILPYEWFKARSRHQQPRSA